ncbi:MAG: redoxin domain-containing protein [candidate division Zixibacteria bacterium]|nr:redoxin domain-containing protein [candidate division Zixibacteria bacterium]
MSSLVTQEAPDFVAPAVVADGEIVDDFRLKSLRGRYTILLFYPLDFTFVCPTEILAFDKRIDDFESRDCTIIGISVDSVHTHAAWRRTPVTDGGIGSIRFPLVSDLSHEIAESYGVLVNNRVALRGLFLLDRNGVVRHALINDDPIGRSVDEALRTLDALRFYDEYGQVCPANWKNGEAAITPTATGVVDYLSKYAG